MVLGLMQQGRSASFADESGKDMDGWMVANLDPELLPGYDMLWDRRVARGSKASA